LIFSERTEYEHAFIASAERTSNAHPVARMSRNIVVEYPDSNLPDPRDQIDPTSPDEIAALARELGVSAYHLHKVVTRVGPFRRDIYHALGLRDWEIARITTPEDDGSTA
jgi:hypothetical protein